MTDNKVGNLAVGNSKDLVLAAGNMVAVVDKALVADMAAADHRQEQLVCHIAADFDNSEQGFDLRLALLQSCHHNNRRSRKKRRIITTK